MGKTYDALMRAQQRSGERAWPASELSREERPRRRRRWPWLQRSATEGEDSALPPELLVQILAATDQIAALDERIRKKLPELEGRVLHLVETRLGGIERQVERVLEEIPSDALGRIDRLGRRLDRLVWLGLGLGLLVLLRLIVA